ncbi:MAG: D-2-hydroxyacid dehydrogenase family protein [Paracoccaceae bacterium]
MKVHILDDWFDTLRTLPCFDKLDGHDVTVWNDHEPDPVALAERVKDAEALVLFRERTKITAELVDRLPNLKLISQRSVYPHIDVEACTRNNVLLCSKTGGAGTSYAAAELTLALMLASYRQIPAQFDSVKAGNWQSGVGRTLRRRTLGLYGYGKIAKAVASYATALGMKIQWWGSEAGRARAEADGQMVAESRESFFATSDVVSVHVRLTPETRGTITADDLATMGSRALFINTSRSGLVEKGALEAGIAKGNPGYAAVDVFDEEPLTDTSHPLLTHPNVIATPHIGFVTEDEFNMQFSDIFDQINAYVDGTPIHMVNPDVWTG